MIALDRAVPNRVLQVGNLNVESLAPRSHRVRVSGCRSIDFLQFFPRCGLRALRMLPRITALINLLVSFPFNRGSDRPQLGSRIRSKSSGFLQCNIGLLELHLDGHPIGLLCGGCEA